MGRIPPWFKLYAGDYLLDDDVFELKPEAEGLLVRMWCLCWRDGYAPADALSLARKSRLDPRYVKRHLQSVMRFFVESEGHLRSPRLERERASEMTLADQKTRVSTLGVEARKRIRLASQTRENIAKVVTDGCTVGLTDGSTRQNQNQIQRKANTTTARKRAAPAAPSPAVAVPVNAIFPDEATAKAYWQVVAEFGGSKNPQPRKTAELFLATLASGATPERLLAAARGYKASVSEPKFMCQFAKWLEDGGWEQSYAQPALFGAPKRKAPKTNREAIQENIEYWERKGNMEKAAMFRESLRRFEDAGRADEDAR